MSGEGGEGPIRPRRSRIKGLVLKVAAQIEFYFSEPNLRRDRNFRKLAGASGTTPVPILKLMKCHKLTELTQDINVVRRAAYESRQLLLVGWKDEFDQGAICRRDPAPPAPRDVNSKTVYVEGLPKDATIEWLQDLIFAITHCKPMFISLPRQPNGFARGFAFIEFNSYTLAENTAKDFNSRKAIATAFLLQSNRRKLFQSTLRRRQIRTLEGVIPSVLPPPIIRFLPQDEQNRRILKIKQEKMSLLKAQEKSISDNGNSKPEEGKPKPEEGKSKPEVRKRRRESERSGEKSGEKRQKKSSPEKTETVSIESDEQKGKRKLDEIEKFDNEDVNSRTPDPTILCTVSVSKRSPPVPTKFPNSAPSEKRARKNSPEIQIGAAQENSNENGKSTPKIIPNGADVSSIGDKINFEPRKPVENDSAVADKNETETTPNETPPKETPKETSENEEPEKKIANDMANDEKMDTARNEVKLARRQKSLFMRARRNSFPPLSGHFSFHGMEFWTSGFGYNCLNGSQGTVSAGSSLGTNGPLIRDISYKGHPIREQSTQTDSSYIQMLKSQRKRSSSKQNHLEKTIDELVKKGRNLTEPVEKKRKIPSMIQVAQVKRKRKSRIRRRKNTKGPPGFRRSSALIIPNWGGLRLKAMIATQWAHLKRHYKTLQKQNMRKLKHSLKDSTFLYAGAALRKHIKHDEICAGMSDDEDDENPSATENENDFNQSDPLNEPIIDPRGLRKPGQAPVYRHGVIVKISSEGALPSPERLRARFNEYGAVAYVERRDDRSGFIRFNNQSGAQKSIEKESFFTLELLTGTQEDNYWEYLLAQREKKRTAERLKVRGVDRIVAKANRQRTKERKLHILFDPDIEADHDMS